MSDCLSEIIIPSRKTKDESPFNSFRLPLHAAPDPLRPPRLTMCFKFSRCRMYFYPNFSISLPLCHTSGSWREECLAPLTADFQWKNKWANVSSAGLKLYFEPRCQVEQWYAWLLLVKGIWVHSIPLKNFPLGNWLVREPELFHVTLHSSPRIDLQIIINTLRQFFYEPEVKLFTFFFCPQMLKTFKFKVGRWKKKKNKNPSCARGDSPLLSFEINVKNRQNLCTKKK